MTHFASWEMLGKLKDAVTRCVLRPADASKCVLWPWEFGFMGDWRPWTAAVYSVESHVVSDFRATAFPVSTPAESSEQPTASPWHCCSLHCRGQLTWHAWERGRWNCKYWKMQVRKNRVRNNNAVTGNTTEITQPNNVHPWNRPRCDRLIGVTKVGLPAFSYAPGVRSRFLGFMLFDFNYGIHANSQREGL